MREKNLELYFTLQSFYIKPLDAPSPGTTVYVKGYTKSQKKPYIWNVDFPSGYHLPFLVKMKEYSDKEWKEMYKVEIVADFGYDSLDWEFCIDDLDVQFFARRENDDAVVLKEQIILGRRIYSIFDGAGYLKRWAISVDGYQ